MNQNVISSNVNTVDSIEIMDKEIRGKGISVAAFNSLKPVIKNL